jgi:hypothetical protein
MAADDRKKRIMEHLALSSDSMKSISPKKTSEPAASTPPPPPKPTQTTEFSSSSAPKAKASDRKRKIMDHVSRSSKDFGNFSLDEKERKSQIIEHVRKTQK